MNAQAFARLRELADGIARELIFAEAGTDLGLLPINSLLGHIEQVIAEEAVAAVLADAVQPARQWVDAALETAGVFNAAELQWLGQWVSWWPTAVQAFEMQQPIPAQPSDWADGGGRIVASSTEQISADGDDEPALVLDSEGDGVLLREFIGESQEHLQNIEQGVLVLESNPADAGTLSAIFRAFHTFKGCAGFLNLIPIQNLAHELESLLDLCRRQEIAITPDLINLILEGGDTLKQFIVEIGAALAGGRPAKPILVPTKRLIKAIQSTIAAAGNGRDLPPAAAPVEGKEADNPKAVARTGLMANTVKVDTVKLDSLVDSMGELVIAQSLVVQNPEIQKLQNEQLNRDLTRLTRISKDLQRTVMSLRMVPIRATFQKMHRLVRDLATHLGKRVELVAEGEDTELDRTIVEELSDPLIHMIRNAVDHGIEMPEVRQAAGKPATGTLWLKALHQGGSIVIEIRDDGRGLNRERILEKAVELGLVQPGEPLTDNEAFKLIFAPGFSTAEKVTDVSGRGVGLDVVQRNIEKLRGKIEIQSTADRGTSFGIYLPLTLAIIDGLLIGVGEQRYILPTLVVRESFRPAARAIKTVQGRGEMIEVRGRLRPLLRLYEHLGIEPDSTDPTRSIVMVVEAGSDIRCILVDRMLGKQEVVIKSLGETFCSNRCVAGAAILGDGRVGLILDPHALVQLEKTPVKAAA